MQCSLLECYNFKIPKAKCDKSLVFVAVTIIPDDTNFHHWCSVDQLWMIEISSAEIENKE